VKEIAMKTNVGLWIDHRKAVLVTVTDQGDDVSQIDSQIEAAASAAEGGGGSRRAPADDIQQRILTEHLNEYYDTVIESVGEAKAILIFGPGEAKTELKARLEKKSLGDRIAAVEAADKMTDGQIAAKVRQYFAETHGRAQKP
jgi:hypothetical protein